MNYTRNLDRAVGATMFFIIEEAKENVLDFSQGTVKAFLILVLALIQNESIYNLNKHQNV